jgi:hypothetical protein
MQKGSAFFSGAAHGTHQTRNAPLLPPALPRPSLRYVRLADGRRREILLGPWDTAESRAEYARVLVELATGPGHLPAS